MNQASVYQPRTASPMSLGMVVMIHGAAPAALVFAKMDLPAPPGFTETDVELLEVPTPPEPEPPPPEPETRRPDPVVKNIDPIVPPPPRPPEEQAQSTQTDRTCVETGPRREAEPAREAAPPAQPPPVPVRKAAK